MSRPGRRHILLMAVLAVAAVATADVAVAAEFMKSRRKGVYSRSRPPAGLAPRYKKYCRRAAAACRGSYVNNKHKFLMDRHKQRRIKDRQSRPRPAPVEHP